MWFLMLLTPSQTAAHRRPHQMTALSFRWIPARRAGGSAWFDVPGRAQELKSNTKKQRMQNLQRSSWNGWEHWKFVPLLAVTTQA